MVSLRSAATVAGMLLGAVAAISGLAHWVSVTLVAFGSDRGYDARLGMLLTIGLFPVLLGIAMIVAANWARTEPRMGLFIVAGASGLLTVVLLLLWQSLANGPDGSAWGTGIGIVMFGLEAIVAALAA